MVHVVLGAPLCSLSNRLRRLALGADEQNAPALGYGVAHLDEGLVQQRNREYCLQGLKKTH